MNEDKDKPYYSAVEGRLMVQEAKGYSQTRNEFLKPSRPFYAISFRAHFHPRNQDFAAAIVDPIAASTKGYTISVVGSKAYSYGSKGTTELDNLLGYRAIEAFERHHEGFIVAMVEEDLKKRGFIVKDLKLYFEACE